MRKCKLEIKPCEMKLLVTSDGDDLLKARFFGTREHPRALLTTLEGLALWQGKPLRCVIFAADRVDLSLGLGAFGDDFWPRESALVRFDVAEPHRRRRRIDGLGTFRKLRIVEGDEG